VKLARPTTATNQLNAAQEPRSRRQWSDQQVCLVDEQQVALVRPRGRAYNRSRQKRGAQ
jgi:hypothetical protein